MSDNKDSSDNQLLSDLVLKPGSSSAKAADLVVEPKTDSGKEGFSEAVRHSLEETEQKAKSLGTVGLSSETWKAAREIIGKFQPVPWFIWRLTNFIFSGSNRKPIPEGMVLGLRRLMFAAASDSFLGQGEKINNLRKALGVLSPELVGAVSAIHATCRRLGNYQFDRIWRPILDDAVLRAQIGFLVGERTKEFGPGRGMLAGFSGRVGLAILIACGTLEQAREALEKLAAGLDINVVGIKIYGCDPLQVSAMVLSACGCGRDAAFGTVQFASKTPRQGVENDEQLRWLAAFTVIENLRVGKEAEISDDLWEALAYNDKKDREDLIEVSRSLVRKGHSLPWIM